MKPTFQRSAVVLAVLAALSAQTLQVSAQSAAPEAPRGARPPEDKEQLERRLASVALLLEKSSAARQIEASGNPQAQALRDSARALRQKAEEAYRSGDIAGASGMLDQAAKEMFSAVRLASPEQLTGAKQQRDFDARMESVAALLAAQKRITAEKKLGAKGQEASAAIEAQMQAAAAMAKSGQLEQARTLLDKVYLTTKISIEGMRSGDTLVRSLNFASKEEEYHYEVDRNDTHKMLVKMLLDEKRAGNPALDGMVQKNLDASAKARADSDALAAKKDFEGAIKLLEDATRELVRAIRAAGLYIPG